MKAPTVSVLDSVRALLKAQSSPSTEVLVESLASAEEARDKLSAEIQSLQAELETSRDEPDTTRARIRAGITAATERLDDAVDLVVGIGTQLAAAQHEADERDRMERAIAAAAEARRAADAFARDWRRVESLLLDTLEKLFTAELAVDAANSNLPAGVEPIASVEYMARATVGAGEEILEEEVIERWVCEDGESILPPAM